MGQKLLVLLHNLAPPITGSTQGKQVGHGRFGLLAQIVSQSDFTKTKILAEPADNSFIIHLILSSQLVSHRMCHRGVCFGLAEKRCYHQRFISRWGSLTARLLTGGHKETGKSCIVAGCGRCDAAGQFSLLGGMSCFHCLGNSLHQMLVGSQSLFHTGQMAAPGQPGRFSQTFVGESQL
jgi:hypothetical protein